MRIIEAENYGELSRWSAQFIAGLVRGKPNCVLGLPTGSTPVGFYKEFVNISGIGLNLQNVQTFNLDEYVGLAPEHPQSYNFFMQDHLFNFIDIPLDQRHIPDGMSTDLEGECRKYEDLIENAGGIDLMVLGLGPNGHIGFNEPDSHLGTKTHVVSLTQETIQANARFFHDVEEVPRQAITMGVGSIMKAEEILLVVSGTAKKEVLRKALYGEVTTAVPASILQLHPHLVVVTDFPLNSLKASG